jgi:hypothetical protein
MANTQQKQKEAVDWWLNKARGASGYRRNLLSNADRSRGTTVIGKMFFFEYDPKHKVKLPIYDRFPLVFPIQRYPDGFLGLNLHYLNGDMRSSILDELKEYASNKRMNETTKLRLSYDLLSRTTLLSSVAPCIKRYLTGHVRSHFIEITANEWDKVAQLPVQVFVTRT